MLHTTLVKGQFLKIGEAFIHLDEIKDLSGKGQPKVVLSVDAPHYVPIEFDQRKSKSKK